MSPEILDVQGAATLLGVSPRTIYKLAAKGTLPAVKLGREWRFARKRLIDWVANSGKPNGQDGSLEALLRNNRVRSMRKG